MEDVIAVCTEALRRNPEDWESLVKRAFAFHRLGQCHLAIKDCTVVIEARQNPNKWDALLLRGRVYTDTGREKRAIRDWEESIRLGNMAEPRHRLLTSTQIAKGHKGLEQGHRA